MSAPSFYVAGGTLPRDAPSYVSRSADRDLFEGLLAGRFCYVLTSRQMGKSSLMVRTAARLRQQGVTCAVLDLTAIGQDLTREQWYDGLQNALGRQLGLEQELDDFWLSRRRLSPLQRWMRALEEVVLSHVSGPIALFLDEIDSVRSLPFAADEFFAGIREFYNRRAECPLLERLTFCLLGVAAPSDLIRDTRTTPFNIGLRIDLGDFTHDEASPLATGLAGSASSPLSTAASQQLLSRVLYWTGGHPYLTQRLCHAISGHGNEPGYASRGREVGLVDAVCANLLTSAQARVQNDNLLFVRDRILRSEVDVPRLLGLYSRILRGRPVTDDEADPLITVLRLSGITRSEKGRLQVRNRIYARVFDRAWLAENMPDDEVRRQRAAFRSGVLRATLIWGAVMIAMAGLGVTAVREKNSARQATERSRRYGSRMEEARKSADRARMVAVSEARRARAAEGKLGAALRKVESRRQDAERQKRIAGLRRAEAEAARRQTTEKLRDSYLAQARASRWSGRVGQKFNSLAAIEKAARYPAPADLRMRLRDEAIACMALPIDLRLRAARKLPYGGGQWALDSRARQLAMTDRQGGIQVWNRNAGTLTARLPGPTRSPAWMNFSEGGRFLAAFDGAGEPLRVWDLQRPSAPSLPCERWRSLIFDGDDSTLFVLERDGVIRRRELRTGRETRVTQVEARPRSRLRLSPDGRRLAYFAMRSKDIQVVDLATGSSFSLETRANLIQATWSSDSSRIAVATDDYSLTIWSAAEKRIVSHMGGHLALPNKLTFLQGDRLVAASGWDPTLRVWDIATGREVLTLPIGGSVYCFGPDGRRLYVVSDGSVMEYDIDPGLECRVFPHAAGVGSGGIAFLPDSSLMVTGAADGLRFWDTLTGREQAYMPTGPGSQAFFAPNTSDLVRWDGVTNRVAVSRVTCDPRRGRVEIGAPFATRRIGSLEAMRCSPDGSRLAIAEGGFISIFALPGLSAELLRGPHRNVSQVSVSPDRRWAASAGSEANDVRIWDLGSGKRLKELPTGPLTNTAFSPDGIWLVTGNTREFRFWRIGSWAPGRIVPRAPGMGLPGPIAFSPDGRQIALGYSQTIVNLYDCGSGDLLARLETPGENLVAPNPQFSPDGDALAVGTECGAVYLWDLRRLRSRLAGMGLDWRQPPLRPGKTAAALKLVLDPEPSTQAANPRQAR